MDYVLNCRIFSSSAQEHSVGQENRVSGHGDAGGRIGGSLTRLRYESIVKRRGVVQSVSVRGENAICLPIMGGSRSSSERPCSQSVAGRVAE